LGGKEDFEEHPAPTYLRENRHKSQMNYSWQFKNINKTQQHKDSNYLQVVL